MIFHGQLALDCLIYLSWLPAPSQGTAFLIETPLSALSLCSVLFSPLLLVFLCSDAIYLSLQLSSASYGFIILLNHFLFLIL